jgi:hypothetical protein
MNRTLKLATFVTAFACVAVAGANAATASTTEFYLTSSVASRDLRTATYLKPTGLEMVKDQLYSPNNGVTWQTRTSTPNYNANLPYGYRRDIQPLFVDPVNGNILTLVNSMDTPGLPPEEYEPPIGEKAYYLRSRTSTDGGFTFISDDPLVQVGKTVANPFDGVYTGQNGYYLGDTGSQPIRTQSGRIIIPAQAAVRKPNGELYNPGVATYSDAMMILGDWQPDNSIQWSAKFIKSNLTQSTRGMLEPTIAQLPDGRLLAVMRGSNGGGPDPGYNLPSYKWYATSSDDGDTWGSPQPWLYDTGQNFFSPSAMSQLLTLSNGKVMWIGNINPTNPVGNDNRYPLVIGEVDPQSMMLIKESVFTVDTIHPGETGVNLSHWTSFQDRATDEIVIVGDRYSEGYTSSTPVTFRLGMKAVADAPIVTRNLVAYFDAGNAGNGVGILGSGSWENLASNGVNHDATLVGATTWGGTGTPNDPFVVQFRQSAPYSFPSSAEAYAKVANSGSGTELDSSVYTYEVWAKIVGPGTGQGNSYQFFDQGALVSHANTDGPGNGTLSYTVGGSWQAAPDTLYGGSSYVPAETSLPNSNGIIGDGEMHHIVLTRAGDGSNDTAWYLDGVLMGTFQTAAGPSDAQVVIAGRNRGGTVFDQGANVDIAQVRIYNAALTVAEVLQNYNVGLTMAAVPGDYNNNGVVDAADYTVWRDHLGQTYPLPNEVSGVTPGQVTQEDYLAWKARFGNSPGSGAGAAGRAAVPEPGSAAIAVIAIIASGLVRRRAARQNGYRTMQIRDGN